MVLFVPFVDPPLLVFDDGVSASTFVVVIVLARLSSSLPCFPRKEAKSRMKRRSLAVGEEKNQSRLTNAEADR
jgi:hypothetical protein